MERFWDLFAKNVVISGLLALGLCGAVVYLAVTGQPVPEVLAGMAGTVVGYFFGAGKVQAAVSTFKSS